MSQVYSLKKAETFRLFLSTEPHPRFPTTLLEGSLKVGVGPGALLRACARARARAAFTRGLRATALRAVLPLTSSVVNKARHVVYCDYTLSNT